MATQTISQGSKTNLLRLALEADGIFEIGCGLGLLVAAGPLTTELGINSVPALMVIGAGLIGAGVWLLWLGTRQSINRRLALAVTIVNDVSSVALIALIIGGWVAPTIEGRWILGLVAGLLMILAIAEYLGVRQAREK